MNDQIKRGYEGMTPTEQQKERMMRKIIDKIIDQEIKQESETIRYQSGPSTGAWKAAAAMAAVLALVIAGGVWISARTDTGANVHLEPGVETQPTEPGEEALMPEQSKSVEELVQPILETYRTAIQDGWDREKCESADISCLVTLLSTADQLGYALTDWHQDGVMELVISDGNVIFDLYCIEDGTMHHVITGEERNSYVLCENNCIRNVASNSAADTSFCFYELKGHHLLLRDEVHFTECLGAACSTYHDNHHGVNHNRHISCNGKEYSEDGALAVIEEYKQASIVLTPIA